MTAKIIKMSETFANLSLMLIAMAKRARSRGLSVSIEPTTGYCGIIQDGNRSLVIHGADPGLNTASATKLANDKFFCNQYLSDEGLAVIPSVLIQAKQPHQQSMPEFPCVVKPNSGFGGVGVTIVRTTEEYKPAIERAFRIDSLVLVQPCYKMRELRLVILDGHLLYAYERKPWIIIGDGETTIEQFLKKKSSEEARNSDRFNPQDHTLKSHLQARHISLSYVPDRGEKCRLFDTANLSQGGEWHRIEVLNPAYVKKAVIATTAIGLRYAGIDFFCESPENYNNQCKIIEVNANPGLEYLRDPTSDSEKIFDKIAAALFDKAIG